MLLKRTFHVPVVAPRKSRRECLFALMLPLLVACAQGTAVQTGSTGRSVSVAEAFVTPPIGGPPIVAVVERRYSNAIQQEISLATNAHVAGQNWFRAGMFGPVETRQAGQTAASMRPISFGGIQAEARAALPGINVVHSPYYVQNRYGPFGYATGRVGEDLCLYGWQKIVASPRLIGNKGAIDIRLRMCQTGATERQLLAVMYGYTVNAFFGSRNWNPYGNPPPPPVRLGHAGADIYPMDLRREQAPAAPRERAALPVPAQRAAPAATPLSGSSAPRGPLVPPPPDIMSETPIVPVPPG
ncbi:hypothetical protein ATER59S_00997 [Aquamicrobium terrae]